MKDCQVLDSRLGVDEGGVNHHTEVIVGGFNEDDLSKVLIMNFLHLVDFPQL